MQIGDGAGAMLLIEMAPNRTHQSGRPKVQVDRKPVHGHRCDAQTEIREAVNEIVARLRHCGGLSLVGGHLSSGTAGPAQSRQNRGPGEQNQSTKIDAP